MFEGASGDRGWSGERPENERPEDERAEDERDHDCPASRSRRREGVSLAALFPAARFIGCDDIVARGCHDDPSRCGPGDIFVARLTAEGDGHEDVARAIARGVAGIVAERMIPTFGTALCLVADSSWALARLAHALEGDPARTMKVIAITGTSGKTTTAWLTASVLAEAGLRVGILSDLGCLDAEDAEPVRADIGRPAVLAAWLARLADGGCTHAVVEVSSRMLAEHALAGVACDTVVVTNLGTAHLEQHGTVEAYHTIKSRILDSLAADGTLVACADDPRVRRLLERHRAGEYGAGQEGAGRRGKGQAKRGQGGRGRRPGTAITVGLRAMADVAAVPVERSLHGQTFLLQAGSHVMPVAVATPVASFVRDALLAGAVGLRHRVPLERIARGLEAAGSVSGRMERIDRGQDFSTFIDLPTSGHALATTLSGLRRLTGGRLVLLAEERLAAALGGGSADPDARFQARAGRWCDECLIVPAAMMAEAAGPDQLAAYARIDRVLASLGQGDCLLVVGDVRTGGQGPVDPSGEGMPLAAIVDGWLQLAHAPAPRLSDGRRRAA